MRTICRVSLVVGFVAIGILGTQPASAAPVEPTLSVQGVLRKSDGTVAVDGTYDLAFRFYAAATGGAALKLVDSKGVPVKRGVFAVTLDLGDKALITGNASLWVGVTVGGDTVELPRQRLVPTAYALQAEHANSADTATSATSADTAKTALSAETAKTATSCDTAKSANALMCTACVAAEAVSFNYAASASKGGAASDLACTGCVSSNEIAACADGQILKFVGTAWTCAAGAGGTVTSVGATAPLASSGGATPNISLTGVIPAANGGTGLSSSGSAGNYLRSDGSAWTSSTISAGDLPAGTKIRAHLGATTTVSNQRTTQVLFGTEDFDSLGEYDPSNGKATFKQGGFYWIHAHVNWLGKSGGLRYLGLFKNKVPTSPGNGLVENVVDYNNAAGVAEAYNDLTTLQQISAGEFICAAVYQDSGSDAQIAGAFQDGSAVYLEIFRVF